MNKLSFKYWFAHWCAFQMTALNLNCWHFRFLFHDIEKPFLKLFLHYDKVQKFHRNHARHHIEYKGKLEHDYLGMIIDWECSRFTKEDSQLNAASQLFKCHINNKNLVNHLVPIMENLGLL